MELRQKSGMEVAFLNNIRIQRAFWLNVDMILEKDRAYKLNIEFDDAPSLLRNETISISNVLNEVILLKQAVSRVVSEEYGIYIVDGILSMCVRTHSQIIEI